MDWKLDFQSIPQDKKPGEHAGTFAGSRMLAFKCLLVTTQ
jgi:hypothetical protein